MTRKRISVEQRLNETINEMAEGLYELNIIDGVTMRDYQLLDIPKVHDFTPQEIKKVRLKEKVSQAVFAKYLNAGVSTVQDWEQGKKHPRGTSLKLLNMVSERGLGILR